MYPSQKTFTKMDLCSEHTLLFCTINEYILLVKCSYDEYRYSGLNVYMARYMSPKPIIW